MPPKPDSDPTAVSPQPRRPVVAIALLALLCGYLLLASSSTLWDRDEPRFARATVEMVASGDYLVPSFNGELRPDKPAGIYWLMAGGYAVLGLEELAFRLPSILGITAASFFTFLIGRRLFSERVGLYAMLFYGSGLLVMYMATAATSDGAMNGLITMSLWCFIEIVHGRRGLGMFAALAVALAGAQLVKGPVGVVVPVISMLGMAFFGWRFGAFELPRSVWLGIGAAVLLSFGAFAAWGIPANAASGGELLKQGLGKHVLERATSPMENHGGEDLLAYLLWLPFYLPVVLIAFSPWTMHLLGGFASLIRGKLGQPTQRAIIWGYLLPTFIMMTLVVTRLPHYIMPIFPALAIMVAAAIDPIHQARLSDTDRLWYRLGGLLVAPGLLAAAIAAAAAGWILPDLQSVRLPGLLLALAIIGFGSIEVISLMQLRIRRATLAALFSMPVVLLIACLLVLPAIETSIKPSKPIADAVNALNLPPDTPLYLCGIGEPSLVFYLDRSIKHPVRFRKSPQDLKDWAQQPGPGVIIATQTYLEQAQNQVGSMALTPLFEAQVIQYSDDPTPRRIVALQRNAAGN